MGRSPCCEKSHTNKGAWTKEEDHRLVHYIRIHGEGSWRSLPEAAGLLRCGKSCRLRWMNYLRPDLKRGNFSDDEDQLIIKLHTLFGNKWSLIAGRLPGRTDNEIKNYWNTHIKRKLASHGIDPQTHRPLNKTGFENEPRASKTPSLVFEYDEFEVKAKSECIEEGYCTSSDMTTDEEQLQSLNLELSIGISSAGKKANSAESEPKVDKNSDYIQFVGQAMLTNPKVVCLCWQLGFQISEICRNCEICRPLGS